MFFWSDFLSLVGLSLHGLCIDEDGGMNGRALGLLIFGQPNGTELPCIV